MNKQIKLMQDRLNSGLDPITGEKMTTGKAISIKPDGKCYDEYGMEVTLNGSGSWVYVHN